MYGTSNGSRRVCRELPCTDIWAKKARDLGYWVKYTVCASPEHTWYGQIEGGNAFFDEIDGLGGEGGGSEEELAQRPALCFVRLITSCWLRRTPSLSSRSLGRLANRDAHQDPVEPGKRPRRISSTDVMPQEEPEGHAASVPSANTPLGTC